MSVTKTLAKIFWPAKQEVEVAPAPSAAGLYWIGGNVGLDFADDKCFFTIQENGIPACWTISQTLARINEFSDAAMARILIACEYQEHK